MQLTLHALTDVLSQASRLLEQDPRSARDYLQRTLPNDIDASALDPLACEALAEVVDLWGLCCQRLRDYDLALRLFDHALDLTRSPRIAQRALYNRGVTRMLQAIERDTPPRALERAEADLREACRFDERDASAWAQLGAIRLLLGQTTKLRVGRRLAAYRDAIAAFDRALALLDDPRARETVSRNRKLAEQGVALFEQAGWWQRNLSRSSTVPTVEPDDVDREVIEHPYRQASGEPRREQPRPPADDPREYESPAAKLLNAPRPEDDDGQRDRDPCSVARRYVQAFAERPPEPFDTPALATAVWLLCEAGQPIERVVHPARAALVELTRAAHARDPAAVRRVLERTRNEPWHRWLARDVDELCARRLPLEVAQLHEDGLALASPLLVESLALRDPQRCLALFDTLDPDEETIELTGHAMLAAIDAEDVDASALEARWASLRPDSLERSKTWASFELRRLARHDLEAAHAFRSELLDYHDETPAAAIAYFARRARAIGKDALAETALGNMLSAFALPRVIGCAIGGQRFDAAAAVYLDDLHKHAYCPHFVFQHLLELCIRFGLTDLLRATLERGGAHGWQTAMAAEPWLRLPEVRADEGKRDELLDLLLARYEPGPVAGRDGSDGGVHVGQIELCPPWLSVRDPKPIEWLVLIAALDDDAPCWAPRHPWLP